MTTAMPSLSQTARFKATSVRAVLFALKARALVVLAVLILLFSYLAPAFFSANNLSILAKHIAISAILAIGMTFVVLTGGIDLSVGSVAGLTGMVAGYLLTQGIVIGGAQRYPAVLICIVLSVAVGMFVGLVNGWLVSKAGVAPFIATLGTLY